MFQNPVMSIFWVALKSPVWGSVGTFLVDVGVVWSDESYIHCGVWRRWADSTRHGYGIVKVRVLFRLHLRANGGHSMGVEFEVARETASFES